MTRLLLLSFVVAATAAAAAANPLNDAFKRDDSKPTEYEANELKQARLMIDKGLPTPICGEDNWAIGLRRVFFLIKEAYPDKEFDLSGMVLSQAEASKTKGMSATLCAIVSMRAAPPKCDEKKEEKPPRDEGGAPPTDSKEENRR